MYADLHIHSYYSDSNRSPEEIVKKARELGIDLLCVSDHNTTAAYKELIQLCKEYKIKLIRGAEISTLYEGKEFHVLAYDFDFENKEIINICKQSESVYADIDLELIKSMSVDYQEISIEEFNSYSRNLKNGGWKGFDYLTTKNLVNNVSSFFKLVSDYHVQPKRSFPSIEYVINAIHKANGKAVIAHIGENLKNNLKEIVPRLKVLKNMGADGFECYYTTHTEETTKVLVDFCQTNNMLITVGNDDHGGFNNRSNVIYEMGGVKVDFSKLNLEDIEILG
ncbi:PHP domain-containing protein [Psychrobacillus sp. MER TA 171]|uniref:PHP domain-containing protein n=1 Tax=Psychrobacillus sp. MER TA 171 TaxID=2939577 RepID=UPI00203D25C1|nr:PHP domain-containing protein [Psychrobacillus sp. MER TA 171]MCM3357706.1 PHP domain-containing protein [Psychrobacillus sp. MER TA 171]